jgi:hypothetical protein
MNSKRVAGMVVLLHQAVLLAYGRSVPKSSRRKPYVADVMRQIFLALSLGEDISSK